MSGKSRDVVAIVEMLLALLLPLFVCRAGVAIASAGATSTLLILALFEEKFEVTERRELRHQKPGSRTSRALTFIANFSFFCSTFPLALRYRGLRFLSVALASHLSHLPPSPGESFAGQCPCCTFSNRLQTGYALRKRVWWKWQPQQND